MSVLHIRSRPETRHERTFGSGSTWCGKKLLGDARHEAECDVFTSYGSEVRVTGDPGAGSCEHCRRAFDAAYNAAFPDGLKPIATIRLDDPDAREKLASLMVGLKNLRP